MSTPDLLEYAGKLFALYAVGFGAGLLHTWVQKLAESL